MTSSRAPQHAATLTLLLKGTVQLNTTVQRQQKAHRQQKVQQQKWRQRSSARSNDSRVSALIITRLQRECPDGFQDPPAPIRIFIIDTRSPQHIGQTSWCPLPSSSSHHNRQLFEKKENKKKKRGLLAPGCHRPLLPVSSNHSSSFQPGLLALGCQRPRLPVSSNHSRSLQPGLPVPACSTSHFQQPQQLTSIEAPGTESQALATR